MNTQLLNRRHWRQSIMAAAVFLLSVLSLLAQDTNQQLYGITFFGNQLISINPNTGEGHRIGPLGTNISGYGIAARYSRLYTFNPNIDEIVEIDPATAGTHRSINIGVTDLQGEGDLAFRSDGVGFLTSALHADGSIANDIYTFDVIAGTSRRIGTTTLAIDALAFDPFDNLFALAKDDNNLYRIDETNGAMSRVGPLGISVNSPFAALTFAPNGVLYAAINDQLYAVNRFSGAASAVSTEVLDIGFSSISGLAFQTPEPPTRLVGITSFGNQLVSIDSTNGGASLIGNLGSTVSGYGIAMRSNVLYTFNPNTDQIETINPSTGQAGKTINIGVTNLQGEGDLAFRDDGVGFLSSALHADGSIDNGLYAFDIVTGTSARIGTTSEAVDALAFDTNNVLYALGQDDNTLYTINTNNGALTAVGPLGVGMSSPFAGLTFGPDGTLFAAINDRLYTIDKSSGLASATSTNVIDFGYSSVSGIAFAASPVQLHLELEAGSYVLYWSGMNGILQSATNVAGPYTTAAFQANPSRIEFTGSQRFFRLSH